MENETNPSQRNFRPVSEEESKLVPYPYIRVNDDRTIRELHRSECEYLEEPFDLFDGGRPYIKFAFEQKDGWGNLGGFCRRALVPTHFEILQAPAEDPFKL